MLMSKHHGLITSGIFNKGYVKSTGTNSFHIVDTHRHQLRLTVSLASGNRASLNLDLLRVFVQPDFASELL